MPITQPTESRKELGGCDKASGVSCSASQGSQIRGDATPMRELTQAERDALGQPSPVDITTTGRRSRQPRRIEIWAHLIEDRIFITSSPGRRNWYANMLAQPDIVLHVKHGTKSDIPVTARPIIDPDERHATFDRIQNLSVYRSRMTLPIAQRIEGSCLVEITLRDA